MTFLSLGLNPIIVDNLTTLGYETPTAIQQKAIPEILKGKNVIAVGNLSKTDGLSGSSSRGPAADGRIKPDVSAVGSSVMSTQAGNAYGSKSGTSMACPAVSGVLLS